MAKQEYSLLTLPKWAQRRIKVAERKVKELEDKVAAMSGQVETNVWTLPLLSARGRRNFLDHDDIVYFRVNENVFRVRVSDNGLFITTDGGSLYTKGVAGNAIVLLGDNELTPDPRKTYLGSPKPLGEEPERRKTYLSAPKTLGEE